MSGPNLLKEFACCVGAMTGATDQYLQALGIPADLLYAGPSCVGATRADLSDDCFYQPLAEGSPVVVVPIGVAGECGWESIDDLLCFRVRDPSRWWLRTGVGTILNPEGLRRAEHFDELLPVWSSPLSWLRSGGRGIAILDWSARLPFWLSGIKAVACENELLAQRLHAALAPPPVELPEIRVMNHEGATNVAA